MRLKLIVSHFNKILNIIEWWEHPITTKPNKQLMTECIIWAPVSYLTCDYYTPILPKHKHGNSAHDNVTEYNLWPWLGLFGRLRDFPFSTSFAFHVLYVKAQGLNWPLHKLNDCKKTHRHTDTMLLQYRSYQQSLRKESTTITIQSLYDLEWPPLVFIGPQDCCMASEKPWFIVWHWATDLKSYKSIQTSLYGRVGMGVVSKFQFLMSSQQQLSNAHMHGSEQATSKSLPHGLHAGTHTCEELLKVPYSGYQIW